MTISMKIQSIEQTCSRSPSQWEGQMDNGSFIYIRYRWGNLTVGFGDTIDEAIWSPNTQDWFDRQIGGELDGDITLEEVCRVTGLIPPDQSN
jgi:hypothetical protein